MGLTLPPFRRPRILNDVQTGSSNGIEQRAFSADDRRACLAIFDANCPRYFAECEREEYVDFLDSRPGGYRVYLRDGELVGACGVTCDAGRARLSWILIEPGQQRTGLGSRMITDAFDVARRSGAAILDVAASQHSAPFFARFGAVERKVTPDGWGPGMDRVDMEVAFSSASK